MNLGSLLAGLVYQKASSEMMDLEGAVQFIRQFGPIHTRSQFTEKGNP